MKVLIYITFSVFTFAFSPRVVAQEATANFGVGETPFLIRSTTDLSILSPVLERFAALNPDLRIRYEQWGSNALFAQSRAACLGRAPAADAVISSAMQHMVWLVNAACAQSYRSFSTSLLPAARRWRDELWGITSEPAVIVFNMAAFSDSEVPRSRFALLDAIRNRPEFFRGRIATYDITASGLGYLFAYADSLEASSFGSMLEGFARVDARAICCSAEIIRDVSDGRFVIAYNVLGSYADATPHAGAGIVQPEDYTLILSRAYMIPQNAKTPGAAARFLEFLLGPEAQPLLTRAGLLLPYEEDSKDRMSSNRRYISLSPALLVAMDSNRRTQLLDLWSTAFQTLTGP